MKLKPHEVKCEPIDYSPTDFLQDFLREMLEDVDDIIGDILDSWKEDDD